MCQPCLDFIYVFFVYVNEMNTRQSNPLNSLEDCGSNSENITSVYMQIRFSKVASRVLSTFTTLAFKSMA